MKMNMTMIMFTTITFTSVIMVMSSNNILFSWISMEINFISFMPIINKSKKINDQTMKYLIIQSMSSSVMLMTMMLNSTTDTKLSNSMLLMVSMMMKMGLMPFHLWAPSLMQVISWRNCMLISTLQKISPTIMMSQLLSTELMMPMMCLNLIMSPITGMKQSSFKKMMAYSSISNSPWMIMATKTSKFQSITFFIIYSTLMTMMTNLLKEVNVTFLNQMNNMKPEQKLTLLMMMLSISGMPPLLGFMPKWMILQSTVQSSMQISISMILSSVSSTFMYLKMIYPTMMFLFNSKKTTLKNLNSTLTSLTINMTSIPLILMSKMN
uniref:NADH-ubiquinone oxidoreductase chain 2 n=1 Tax=Magadhaideus sp. n. SX-2018 TaxID=2220057 RepID=A0A451GIQ9_9HEMI|nr:NADH dehydrogenase subunit 2 [Magadhaideus sp. n. SX-2018]